MLNLNSDFEPPVSHEAATSFPQTAYADVSCTPCAACRKPLYTWTYVPQEMIQKLQWPMLHSPANGVGMEACSRLTETDAHLGEANVLGVLTEALAAYIQPVLPDEPPLVGADTAAQKCKSSGRIFQPAT